MEAFTLTELQLEAYLFRVAGGEPVSDVLLEVALDAEASSAQVKAKRR